MVLVKLIDPHTNLQQKNAKKIAAIRIVVAAEIILSLQATLAGKG